MKEIAVVGAAVIKEGKVLAAQRSPKMKEAYKWEFPGGKVEAGESHRQALQREIYEELGVEIEVQEFVAEGTYQFEERIIHLYVYEARIVNGMPEANEHAQLEWIDIGNLENRIWATPDLPACKVLKTRYL